MYGPGSYGYGPGMPPPPMGGFGMGFDPAYASHLNFLPVGAADLHTAEYDEHVSFEDVQELPLGDERRAASYKEYKKYRAFYDDIRKMLVRKLRELRQIDNTIAQNKNHTDATYNRDKLDEKRKEIIYGTGDALNGDYSISKLQKFIDECKVKINTCGKELGLYLIPLEEYDFVPKNLSMYLEYNDAYNFCDDNKAGVNFDRSDVYDEDKKINRKLKEMQRVNNGFFGGRHLTPSKRTYSIKYPKLKNDCKDKSYDNDWHDIHIKGLKQFEGTDIFNINYTLDDDEDKNVSMYVRLNAAGKLNLIPVDDASLINDNDYNLKDVSIDELLKNMYIIPTYEVTKTKELLNAIKPAKKIKENENTNNIPNVGSADTQPNVQAASNISTDSNTSNVNEEITDAVKTAEEKQKEAENGLIETFKHVYNNLREDHKDKSMEEIDEYFLKAIEGIIGKENIFSNDLFEDLVQQVGIDKAVENIAKTSSKMMNRKEETDNINVTPIVDDPAEKNKLISDILNAALNSGAFDLQNGNLDFNAKFNAMNEAKAKLEKTSTEELKNILAMYKSNDSKKDLPSVQNTGTQIVAFNPSKTVVDSRAEEIRNALNEINNINDEDSKGKRL